MASLSISGQRPEPEYMAIRVSYNVAHWHIAHAEGQELNLN